MSQNRELIFGSGSSTTNQQQTTPPLQKLENPPTGHINFPQPRTFSNCRICEVLQTQGVSVAELFQQHVSDYATGCPQFATLGTDQRMLIAKEAKFCLKCMGKETKYGLKHNRECPIFKQKSIYSCKRETCYLHMWLCSNHQAENKEQMERFEEQLRAKSGIRLVFMVNKKAGPSSPSPTTPHSTCPPNQSQVLPGSSHSFCATSEKGIDQAVKKMEKMNRKKDPSTETVSPPAGAPLFMFQPVEGLSEPVNVFYDCGCSDAVFRC